MKQRKPPKARNIAARALFTNKLFAAKSVPAKKGKGTSYNRKQVQRDRGDHLGPYLLALG